MHEVHVKSRTCSLGDHQTLVPLTDDLDSRGAACTRSALSKARPFCYIRQSALVPGILYIKKGRCTIAIATGSLTSRSIRETHEQGSIDGAGKPSTKQAQNKAQ